MGIVVKSQGVWFYILKGLPPPPQLPSFKLHIFLQQYLVSLLMVSMAASLWEPESRAAWCPHLTHSTGWFL